MRCLRSIGNLPADSSFLLSDQIVVLNRKYRGNLLPLFCLDIDRRVPDKLLICRNGLYGVPY